MNISDSTLLHGINVLVLSTAKYEYRKICSIDVEMSVGSEAVQIEISNNICRQTTDFAIKNWAKMLGIISQDESDDGKNYYYALDMI